MRGHRGMRGYHREPARIDCNRCENTGWEFVEVKLPDGRQASALQPCHHGRNTATPPRPAPIDRKMEAANDRE